MGRAAGGEPGRDRLAGLFHRGECRSARRFLSKAGFGRPIDSLEFRELNEHTTDARAVDEMVRPILAGRSAGVISEAGVREWPIPGPWRWPGVTGSESAWCL